MSQNAMTKMTRGRRNAHGATRANNSAKTFGQNTPTPPSVCQWIRDRLIKAGVRPKQILDPCAGRWNLLMPFMPTLPITYELRRGKDFFNVEKQIECDLVLCNPPWSDAERWLRQIVAVVGNTTPIVFICPMVLLVGPKTGSFRKFLDSKEAPTLNAVTPLPQDTFVGAYSPSVILWFNIPRIRNVGHIQGEHLRRTT